VHALGHTYHKRAPIHATRCPPGEMLALARSPATRQAQNTTHDRPGTTSASLQRQSLEIESEDEMKLIWLSHFLPFPPRGGALQRSFNLLREASRRHDTTLITFNRPAVSGDTLAEYTNELRKVCAAVEVWELPFAWRGIRWWLGLLSNPTRPLPHSCEAYRSEVLLRRWEAILQANPDATVHIDSSDLAVFTPAALRGHRVLLNHHNCESAMAERRARLESNPLKRIVLAAQAKRHAVLEQDLCARVAVNAVVSHEDGQLLLQRCPSAHVHVVANGTDTHYFAPQAEPPRRSSLVFAGSLKWYPNVSGLRAFRRRIWPTLKAEVTGLECILAGKSPVREVRAWAASDPAITLVDTPPDIRPWVAKGTVFICPVVDGGGTRLKLIDAMASGKAIVTTRVGAEGLGIENGKQAMVAESDDEFIRMTLRLLREPELRKSLAANAREYAERHFGWEVIGESLEAGYACTHAHFGVVSD
jgi:glycosyltransferase involved in cell wall biosynthesis